MFCSACSTPNLVILSLSRVLYLLRCLPLEIFDNISVLQKIAWTADLCMTSLKFFQFKRHERKSARKEFIPANR